VPLTQDGQVQGSLGLPSGARGDGLVFLYPPGEGPPLRPASPSFATGVSDVRIASGDTSFVIAGVPPNPYHVWGFLDVDRNFQPSIDVLAQPGAGDRVSAGSDFNLEPGQTLTENVTLSEAEPLEPPGFHIVGASSGTTVEIPDQVGVPTLLTLEADDLGVLAPGKVAFAVSLPDAGDPNATPDGLGVPVLYPQVFLRFLPAPGQTVPVDAQGNPADVILPLAFDPAAFLITLGTDPSAEVLASSLAVAVIHQAQAITYPPGAPRTVTALSAIPVGSYELWVLQKSGQFWRIPNDLDTSAAAPLGGPIASQGVQFIVVHGFSVDGGL
jgi:hypothetical protein